LFSGTKYLSKAAVTFITSLKAAQANILPPKQKKPTNNYRLANRGKCIEIFGFFMLSFKIIRFHLSRLV
jgi:hypothetical protein